MAVLSLTVFSRLNYSRNLKFHTLRPVGAARAELLEKLIGVHEHRKVPATVDRHKLFTRCFDGLEVIPSKCSRSRKVFSSLNEEHRKRKFEAEFFWSLRLGLAHKM